MNKYFRLKRSELETLEEEFVQKDREKRNNRMAEKIKREEKKLNIAKKSQGRAGAYIIKGNYCTSRSSKKKLKHFSHRQERRRKLEEYENFLPIKRGGFNISIPKSQYVTLLALRN